jgi:peptidoglycan/xylan/chitin deacetylase (PgdA/CDA1 family)
MHDPELYTPTDAVSQSATDQRSAKRDWHRTLFRLLSPVGQRGRLTILIFHRVHEQRDELFPTALDAATFRERMLWISSWFNVLPLGEAVTALSRGSMPARALAITFDDGYGDNCTVALPILRQLGLHATFFISTAFLDGGAMFNDIVIDAVRRSKAQMLDLAAIGLGAHPLDSPAARRAAIDTILQQLKYLPLVVRQAQTDAIAAIAGVEPPADLMMTSNQVRTVAAAGMGIGAHTMKHPILATIDHDSARDEIAGSREALQGLLRQPVKLFAYPNGKPGADYSAVHVAMVKALGFAAAVSTAPGAASVGNSLYELPRFTPWDHTRARWAWRLARNLGMRIERAAA